MILRYLKNRQRKHQIKLSYENYRCFPNYAIEGRRRIRWNEPKPPFPEFLHRYEYERDSEEKTRTDGTYVGVFKCIDHSRTRFDCTAKPTWIAHPPSNKFWTIPVSLENLLTRSRSKRRILVDDRGIEIWKDTAVSSPHERGRRVESRWVSPHTKGWETNSSSVRSEVRSVEAQCLLADVYVKAGFSVLHREVNRSLVLTLTSSQMICVTVGKLQKRLIRSR